MSGECLDCGNPLCICDETKETKVFTREEVLESFNAVEKWKLDIAVEALKEISEYPDIYEHLSHIVEVAEQAIKRIESISHEGESNNLK